MNLLRLLLIINFLTPLKPLSTGKIKCILEYYYSLNGETKKLSKTTCSTYDKKGRISEMEEKDSSGKLIRKEIYRYNSPDSLAEKRIFGSDGKTIYRSEITYDLKENKKECSNFINEDRLASKTITLFDPSGKILRYDTYTSDGKLYNTHLFEYEKAHQKESISYPDGSIEWKCESFFDEYGNLIQKNEYPSCCLSIQTNFTYDSEGNILSQKSSREDGSNSTFYSYTYQEEDQQKNWLAQIISENGKPTTLVKRKIEYYK